MKKDKIVMIAILIIMVLTVFVISIKENVVPDSQGDIGENREISIPILMYHHLSPNEEDLNTGTIYPEKFKRDMEFLKTEGYTTIFAKDIIDHREGKRELPPKPIMITFDDGYSSNYKYAFPILKELNMKATISVIGWSVGRSKHMDNTRSITPHFSWDDAKEMYESGLIDIQAHTFDLHSPLGYSYGENNLVGLGVAQIEGEDADKYRERFMKDTLKIKEMIESNVGNEVLLYAYPYGVYNETTEDVLKELDFEITLTTISGVANIKDDNFLLPRINIDSMTDLRDVLK